MVVKLLIGMGGVGQYLVVAAVDIDVHHGLFFCHFHWFFYGRTTWGAVDVRSKALWTYVQRVLGCTSIEPMNPNRSLEKVSCHFLMTAIRKTVLYMLDL